MQNRGGRHVGRLNCKEIKTTIKTAVVILIYLVCFMPQLLQNTQWKLLISYRSESRGNGYLPSMKCIFLGAEFYPGMNFYDHIMNL